MRSDLALQLLSELLWNALLISAPLLAVNGAKDPWMTIQDVYVLFEGGEPKSARVYPEGGHMGGDPGSGPMIVNWIKSRFGMTGGS